MSASARFKWFGLAARTISICQAFDFTNEASLCMQVLTDAHFYLASAAASKTESSRLFIVAYIVPERLLSIWIRQNVTADADHACQHLLGCNRLKDNIAEKLQADFGEWLEVSRETLDMQSRVEHTQAAVQFLAGRVSVS